MMASSCRAAARDGDGWFEHLADLEDRAERGALQFEEEAEGAGQVVRVRRGHDRATARPRLHGDDAVHLEEPERLPQRAPTHLVLRQHLPLRGQLRARGVGVRRDLLHELLGHDDGRLGPPRGARAGRREVDGHLGAQFLHILSLVDRRHAEAIPQPLLITRKVARRTARGRARSSARRHRKASRSARRARSSSRARAPCRLTSSHVWSR